MGSYLDDIKKSEINGYVAEVFYEELKFILGENYEDQQIWIKNHGMNSRAYSKDVLDTTNYDYLSMQLHQDTIYIHLSRNSIYHQLPEILFHPLVISNPSMSNREVVEAIKENKRKEEANIHFFIPFDTQIFEQKLKLSNRHLNIFTDAYARQNLFTLAKDVIDKEIPLTKAQFYKLFLNLCNAEVLKENLPELEKLLRTIIGLTIKLEYRPCVLQKSPFKVIGEGILGYTLGTQGNVVSEYDDIYATILLEEQLTYKELKRNKRIIQSILEFFVLAYREIKIQYRFISSQEMTLGMNYLGYDTIVCGKTIKHNKTKEAIEALEKSKTNILEPIA
ncbi:hypothetical protein [Aquimarina rhabdastrellae]